MMRRASKIWLTVGIFLLISGLGLFAAAMTANRWDFSRLSTAEYETNTHQISETFHSIVMETDTADIRFVSSEDGACKVVCHESTKEVHTVAVVDGVLTVGVTDEREWYDYIGVNIGTAKITVYLPEPQYTTLYIRESTGDVEIPRNFKFSRMEIFASTGDVYNAASVSGEIKIKTNTGDICVESLTAGALDLSVSTGKITAESITCEGEMMVHVSTGHTRLTNVKCGNLTAKGSTGDIFLRNVIAAERFSIERSTGDIRFDGCDAAEIFLKTSTGDIAGNFLSEKVFVTKVSTGKVDVPQTVSGGKCEAITDTGNIRIQIG